VDCDEILMVESSLYSIQGELMIATRLLQEPREGGSVDSSAVNWQTVQMRSNLGRKLGATLELPLRNSGIEMLLEGL